MNVRYTEELKDYKQKRGETKDYQTLVQRHVVTMCLFSGS